MRGRDIQPPLPESLRLYVLCENMNWAHLPLPGGIYDQHPKFVDEMEAIFRRVARKRAEDLAKQKREAEAARRRSKR